MEQLQEIKNMLITFVHDEVKCIPLKQCNTEELGEVIDMIKDLCEATYYCSITK